MRLIDTQPRLPLPANDPRPTWGLAWHHRLHPAHKHQSTAPFAATHDETLATCRRMDQEFPDLHHWPVIVAGRAMDGVR
jgi:hypothetical protein